MNINITLQAEKVHWGKQLALRDQFRTFFTMALHFMSQLRLLLTIK
ncbi:hypothetical protein QG37_02721 [Candidozyma auris]|uniref:Uncharacterized protein n=1 Tax=Candidozyma auris TaxID=498019 RepID=A0A0L0P2D5_CANAR|nr:hypothetical protein QG37_02721 [[Candida] auris]